MLFWTCFRPVSDLLQTAFDAGGQLLVLLVVVVVLVVLVVVLVVVVVVVVVLVECNFPNRFGYWN